MAVCQQVLIDSAAGPNVDVAQGGKEGNIDIWRFCVDTTCHSQGDGRSKMYVRN